MKIKVLLLTMTIAAAFTACNQNDDESNRVEPEEVEISFTTEIQGGTDVENLKVADSEYDRNDAPAYISGIEITADHVDFEPITEVFPFEDNEGDVNNPITMECYVGENNFSAVTTTEVNSFYKEYLHKWDITVPDIPGIVYPLDLTSQTYEERASKYSAVLTASDEIYADYETAQAQTENISFGTNSINLTLTPTTGRTNLIFEQSAETQALSFRLKIGLYDDMTSPTDYSDDELISVDYDALDDGIDETPTPGSPKGVYFDGSVQSQHDKASAFIFNLKEMVAGTYVKAEIEKYVTGTTDYISLGDVIVVTQTGKNVTHFIYLNAESFETSTITATISEFTEYNNGEEVN